MGRKSKVRQIIQLLVVASVPIILVVVNHMLSREFDNVRVLADEVEQAHRTGEQLLTVLSVNQDIETGQRGYVLTGDTSFLEPYATAERRLDNELAALDALARGKPVLQRAMPALRELSARNSRLSAEAIRLAGADRPREEQAAIARQGKATMDALRARVTGLDRLVTGELAATDEVRVAARVRAQRVAFALQSLLVVMLIIAAWMLARSLRTERRIAREYQDLNIRQEAIFDAATDGLLIHDMDGNIDAINPAVARMHGYDQDELTGRHIDMLFEKPWPRDQLKAYLKRLAETPKGGTFPIREFMGCRKDGSAFPGDVVTSPVKLADGTYFLASIRDASERKRVEQIKNEFVSTVSHELRTPLTSIAGSLGLLAGGAAGALSDKARRLIEIAHSNSERLVRLINDILDIEKIESGKMSFNLAWLRLAPVLEHAVQANRGFATEHHVELELGPVPPDAAVVADEDRLAQVITNLVSNACKFSPPGETVRIWVTPMGDRHRITVADRGTGIPEKFRDRIFGKFAQADASDTRAKGGSGLGLSIVREIVSRLGGSVSFDSVEGEGSSFHVDLPAARTEDAPAAEAPHRAASDMPLILHVDDDPDMLRVVASAFEGKAEIHSTPSVREGHAALRRQRFDAAILDVVMADGSGLDLLPLLRDGPAPTPTILFTVHDPSPAFLAQVDAVLTKSRSTFDELVDRTLGLVEGSKETV